MTYTNAEHLREWEPGAGDGPADEPQHYCGECGEPIEAEHAPCVSCDEERAAFLALVESGWCARLDPMDGGGHECRWDEHEPCAYCAARRSLKR